MVDTVSLERQLEDARAANSLLRIALDRVMEEMGELKDLLDEARMELALLKATPPKEGVEVCLLCGEASHLCKCKNKK